MVEAMVTSVGNDYIKYTIDEVTKEISSKTLEEHEYNFAKSEMKNIARSYLNKKGIELGNVQILVGAKLLLGER